MELEQLKKMELAKLNAELLDARKELFETRFSVQNGQSKSAHLIGICKKYIAQLKTVIKQNEKQEKPNNSKN